MPSIVLVRHGPVAVKAPGLLSLVAFEAFIEAYEQSGIEAGAAPPESVGKYVRAAATIFASDAPRVLDTLTRLQASPSFTDAAFREAPPRAPRLPGRWPEIVWLALARARGAFDPALSEARADLRRRAATCHARLIESAGAGDVALVGHGWFNRYVARELTQSGWRNAGGPGFGRPWGYVAFAPGKDA
jgi:hypothetical protein